MNLLAVVVFEEIAEYFKDYLYSINNQTCTDFDLLIICDNFTLKNIDFNVNTIIKNVNDKTPAEIRSFIIKYAKENKYDNLIFSDADDIHSKNRVELVLSQLNKNPGIVFNSLSIVDQDLNLLESKIENYFDPKTFSIKDLIKKNIIGLSNSAITLNIIDSIEIPGDIIAIDWYFYSVLLLNKANISFVDDAITFYRQFENNTVGYKANLTKKRLERIISVKKMHYNYMKKYCELNDFKQEYGTYTIELENLVRVENELKDIIFSEKYISVINKNINAIYTGWWSEILSLEDWSTYDK